MHVAMYKAPGQIGNKLIKWWDGSYSHGEFVYYEKETKTTWGLSSSMRDGGVRAKKIVFKKAHWDFVNITCLGLAPLDTFQKAKEGEGIIGYDYLGISGFVARPIKEDPDKEFCTEFLARILGWTQPWRFGPSAFTARLVDEVNKANGNKNLSLDNKGFLLNSAGILEPEWAV
jgi:hypothetical protein